MIPINVKDFLGPAQVKVIVLVVLRRIDDSHLVRNCDNTTDLVTPGDWKTPLEIPYLQSAFPGNDRIPVLSFPSYTISLDRFLIPDQQSIQLRVPEENYSNRLGLNTGPPLRIPLAPVKINSGLPRP